MIFMGLTQRARLRLQATALEDVHGARDARRVLVVETGGARDVAEGQAVGGADRVREDGRGVDEKPTSSL